MFEGPCEWPVQVCDDCCDDAIAALPPEVWQMFQQWAAWYLWRATGGVLGLCETTFRPCRRECGDYWGGLPYPTRLDGEWVNISCGTCRGACGCDTISEVVIPNVYSVERVTIDGVELDPETTVVVYDRRRIVRIDGGQWPACQNLSIPSGPGAWSITVKQGWPIPPGASTVAGILACELAKACLGDSGCRLPRRIQTLTREGVTVGFQDAFESLADLRVGLFEVDMFIESVRNVKNRQATFRSPDVPRPAVMTWPLPVVTP